ncbi:amino acid adenylation domain-containing protein [Vibrio ruber]|nr:non-ribosomal peptide synthetase [Vibrio ruber]WNJ96979.1 amino acid adenylation domain-containing protein [Vibrio ruber]
MSTNDDLGASMNNLSGDDVVKLFELAKARGLKRKKKEKPAAIEPVPRSPEGEPLALAQRRIWFLSEMEQSASDAYIINGSFRLKGQLDVAMLRATLDRMVSRHESLRTVFITRDGQPLQRIMPADTRFLLNEIPCDQLDRIDLSEPYLPHFDLSAGPLVRAELVHIQEHEFVLRVALHHAIADGWSMSVFIREVGMLYAALCQGQSNPLPPLPIQFADYAHWQQSFAESVIPRQRDYWIEQLRDAPECLALKTDFPRPAVQDHAGASVNFTLDPALTAALKALGQRHDTTLFMTLFASWATLMSRLSGQDDVVIGAPIAGRNRAELEGLIGMFVNTQALRVDLSQQPDTPALLAQVKNMALAAQSNQDIPFEQVVEATLTSRDPAYTPLFQVIFALQNLPDSTLSLPGISLSPEEEPFKTAKFDLSLLLSEADDTLSGYLNYATALFKRATVERYLGYWIRLLQGMVEQPELPVTALPILGEDEFQTVIHQYNQTRYDYPADKGVHALFAEQVNASPDATAVVTDGGDLTYAMLEARANAFAYRLQTLGVQPGQRVAILLPRSAALIQAELAILKVGAVYVPLDPAAPTERLDYILDNSGAKILIAEPGVAADYPALKVLEMDAALITETRDEPVSVPVSGEAPAYVMYTSGSTGQPKGVVVSHRGISRLVINSGYMTVRTADRFSFAANPAFDATTFEVWAPLLNGATVVVIDQETLLNVQALELALINHQVSVLWMTIGLFNQYAQDLKTVLPGLRYLLFGGDSPDPMVIRRVLSEGAPQHVVHCYGPTETTTFATTHEVIAVDEDAVNIPLGYPIGNTQIYLLNSQGQPVPQGVVGELYIGGDGVALGYLNQDELTAERFIPDPYSPQPNARMYKTGDLGYRHPDGTIEFIGRNDFQVKIRGFRIELGEIEVALLSSGADSAVVLAQGSDAGSKRLVAYFTTQDQQVTAAELKSRLAERLPDYMVPKAYVALDKMPLNANGKVDRKALPEPDESAFVRQAFTAPQGIAESTVADIWSSLLSVEQVGRDDNFFELGGQSLLAVQMIERLRQRGYQMVIRDLFARPTLAALAETLVALNPAQQHEIPPNLIPADCQHITPEMLPLVTLNQSEIDLISETVAGGAGNIQDIYPLAPLQEGILFHHLLAEQGDPYITRFIQGFSSETEIEIFITALQQVVQRHDILRTAVVWDGLETPVQVVWREAPVVLKTLHASQLDHAGQTDDVAEALSRHFDPTHTRMDIQRAPMIEIYQVADPAQDRWLLCFLFHHLCNDHTTLELLVEEVQSYIVGREAQLPKPLPFRNFVAKTTLNPADREQHLRYFQALLGDLDEPCVPFGLQTQDELAEGVHVAIEPHLSEQLRLLARQKGLSPAALFHLAWGLVVRMATGQDDVVFGTVLFGRMAGGEGADRVLGMFLNTLPLRLSFADASAESALDQTQQRLGELLEHEHTSLALAQQCSGVSNQTPLFSSLLNYRYQGGSAQQTEETDALGSVVFAAENTNYPITVAINDIVHGGFSLDIHVSQRIGGERVGAMLVTALSGLVDALMTPSDTSIRQLNLLPADEQDLVLNQFNQTQTEFPDDTCLHTLIEGQVARNPDVTAVIFEDQSLSYAELNARANQLAHWLIEQGVRPDSRVAVCLERSCELVVSLLAILKAGGAYVPLDPGYPAERLTYMLSDSAPVALLTTGALRDVLGEIPASTRLVDLASVVQPWEDCPQTNPEVVELTNRHLAYIIYTSGSTGLPKGVMNEHRGVVNRLYWMQQDYGFGSDDVVLQKTPFSFDVSVWEFFCPLWSGATLLMAKPEGHKDPDYLKSLITNQGVTILHFVPPMLQSFLEVVSPEDCPSLRLVFCSGEALPAEAIRKSYARLPQIELHNLYGPTEAAVDVTAWHCPRQLEGDRVSIGHPVANTHMYVLDSDDRPVPVGVEGELYIGGVQVARGYLNRDELTAERFVTNPYDSNYPVMYRTGDVGCWLADGTIEYRGRNDDQVKIRGFRIELGEISSALQGCGGVQDAVVIARAFGESGDKQLVGYYTAVNQDTAPDVATLKAELSERLPAHMVPAVYVLIDAMPLTPNGKVNRKALPEPDISSVVRHEYQAPVGDAEEKLAAIWSELLGVEQVGRSDNFFELGGHSLLAVRMAERLRQHGYQLVIRHLFSRVTLAELAETLQIRDSKSECEIPPNLIPDNCQHITPEMLPLVTLDQKEIDVISQTVTGGAANIQDIYPLAPLQEGILFHHLLEQQGDPYVTRVIQSFKHEADIETFIAALQHVVQRHDILRTAVVWDGIETPLQVVWRQAPIVLQTLPASQLCHADGQDGVAHTEDMVTRLCRHFDPAHTRIDIQRAPMIEAYQVADPAQDRWLLCFLLHHLCNDHTTLELLIEEVQAYLSGREAELPRPLPFRNFVAQTTLKVNQEAHLDYFRELLGDIDEPCDPFGLQASGDNADVTATHMTVADHIAQEIRELSRHLSISPAALFHLAWGVVAQRASGQEDVVFGTVLFGRMAGGDGADRVLGMFLNTLPLRISFGADISVESALMQTQQRLAELLEREHTSLALAQQCSGVSNQTPLFSSLLNYRYQGGSNQTTVDEQTELGSLEVAAENTNYPLTVAVNDIVTGGFSLDIHVSSRFSGERVGTMLMVALETLVSQLSVQPAAPISQLGILSDAERDLVLNQFNQTQTEFPDDTCLHTLIEAQVARNPDATAVIFEDQSLSYAELNARANQLAHWLIEQGVRPDSRVAVCLERSCELVVSLLAILKAGGAYVPLDPGYPTERLTYMLSDSAPVALLTTGSLLDVLGEIPESTRLVDLASAVQPWEDCPQTNPEVAELTNRHLAYIIYTSGSTGLPKGVMNEHRGVVNRLYWMQQDYGFGSDDVVLQKTPFSFDVSVWEFFCPLWSGATLLMAKPEGHKDPDYLKSLITRQGVTILHFVPPMLQSFLEVVSPGDCPSLRLVFCSGEALPAEAIRKSYARLPQIELHNLYGPTEAAVDVTAWHCPRQLEGDRVSIGHPVANTQMYVLDSDGRPVPVGVEGELYIGGVQVARGYLNRDELTAERFVANPYNEAYPVMYRTGDVGCWLADGTIEYRGRNDDQVKIRGFRIELGEISSALQGCTGVQDAVVIARAFGESGDKQLVGYYTAVNQDTVPDVVTLKAELSERLPAHMVPAVYVLIDAMPLTPNGKVNRKALPAPDISSVVRHEYQAPVGDAEEKLAAIWSELLGVEQVGRADNFFELGGHSLLAVRMVSRVREQLGRELSLATLFSHSTLHEVAALLDEAQGAALPAIIPLTEGEAMPLSLAQKRLWFLSQMDEQATAAYTVPRSVRLQGKLDVDALQRALDQIVARHATLRTHFALIDDEPLQVVSEPSVGFPLTYLDGEGVMDELAPLSPTFDLSQGPLVQGQLIRVTDDEHWLRIVMHHMITDGWSMGIFNRELATLYTAHCNGEADPLPPLTIQYGDYAAWQQTHLQGEVLQHQQQYWTEQLRDIPDCLTLPTDYPRPAHQDYRGASLPVTLSRELTEQLRHLSQHSGCTLYMTLLAGWSVALGRLAGQDDIVIGSPIAGRTQRDVEDLIGMFVNSMAMRVQLTDSINTSALLAQVKDTALAAQANQDMPFEQVVETVAPVRSLSHAPIFQVMFALQNTPTDQIQLPDLTLEALDSEISTAQFDLSLEVHEHDGGISGYLTYATALFEPETVQRYLNYWTTLLEAMVRQPELAVNALPMLTDSEQQHLLRDVNQTHNPYPSDCGVHTLFSQQASSSPEAIAVITETGEWHYAALEARANALAQRLQTLGVTVGQRVTVRLPRSAALVVAELAILKVGAVYVPLDPNAPAERQRYVLDDCGASVLVTETQITGSETTFDTSRLTVVTLTDSLLEELLNEHGAASVSVSVSGDAPAYVMYTSGSTGQPKGVVVPHRAIARLVLNNGYMAVQPSDRVALAANPAFDATTLEVWAPLLNGAAVVVIEQDTLLNVQSFAQALIHHRVSILWLTVGLFNQYAQGLKAVLPSLRYLLVGGDALDPAVIRRVLAESAPQHLLNGYGPTETTTFALTHAITSVDEDALSIPLGRPIGNTQVYLLNAHGQPVPQGVVGELHIGGDGVALGYLNQDELTAERFIPDPYSSRPDARMYRTGDLGYLRADGTIEFVGRNDFQVKVRGFRIELGEIESALVSCGVASAVVIASGDAASKRLVAYFTPGDEALTASELKSRLATNLPDYMVPAAYVALAEMPLTANGKVDRKALPEPDETAFVVRQYEAPKNAMETTLAEIWSQLLNVERVGRQDDFFELGGHSLLAVRLISEIQHRLRIEVTITELFEHSVLSALAMKLAYIKLSAFASQDIENVAQRLAKGKK